MFKKLFFVAVIICWALGAWAQDRPDLKPLDSPLVVAYRQMLDEANGKVALLSAQVRALEVQVKAHEMKAPAVATPEK